MFVYRALDTNRTVRHVDCMRMSEMSTSVLTWQVQRDMEAVPASDFDYTPSYQPPTTRLKT